MNKLKLYETHDQYYLNLLITTTLAIAFSLAVQSI